MTGVDTVHSKLGLSGDGIKIAVIDTGVDYTHPSLGGCFGRGCKISNGYNFVETDGGIGFTGVKPTPYEDCIGHGTHVAGIIAARDTGFVGVAPNSTLTVYRIFGCSEKSVVSTDVVLKALLKAFEDGNDIINMSFGSGFSWAQYLDSRVSSGISQHGVIIVSAFGNSGDQGMWSGGSPSLGDDVIAVGSVDNTVYYSKAIKVLEYPNRSFGISLVNQAKNFPLTLTRAEFGKDLSNEFGCNPYTSLLNGTVVFVTRGECTFEKKVRNAENIGAAGLLIVNNSSDSEGPSIETSATDIPVAIIGMEDGALIYDSSRKFNKTHVSQLSNDVNFLSKSGGQVSIFSSLGPGPLLEEKPDILAPGGNIFSTYPMKKGGYKQISGTSMSSPYISGVAALWLENIKKQKKINGNLQNTDSFNHTRLQKESKPNSLGGSNAANYAAQFKTNLKLCGVPVSKGLSKPNKNELASVVKQGAGLVDALCVIKNTVSVCPSQIRLGDSENNSSKTKEVKIKNNSEFPAHYQLVHKPAESVSEHDIDGKYLNDILESDLYSEVSFEEDRVYLGPGEEKNIRIAFKPPKGAWQQYWVYSGHIMLSLVENNRNHGVFNLSIPYLGMLGNYSQIPVLPPADSTRAPFISTVQLLSELYNTPKINSSKSELTDALLNKLKSDNLVFPLDSDDIPVLVVKLDHPTLLLQVELINSDTFENMGFLYPGGISSMLGRSLNRGSMVPQNEGSGYHYTFPFAGLLTRLELMSGNGALSDNELEAQQTEFDGRFNEDTMSVAKLFRESVHGVHKSGIKFFTKSKDQKKGGFSTNFSKARERYLDTEYTTSYGLGSDVEYRKRFDSERFLDSGNVTKLFIEKAFKMKMGSIDNLNSDDYGKEEEEEDYVIRSSIVMLGKGRYFFRARALGPVTKLNGQGVINEWKSPTFAIY